MLQICIFLSVGWLFCLSWPYTRQLLSPATRQHYCSCMLCMNYWMLHSTSCLRIDSPSISKWLVECTMRYFHAQHVWAIMLPCRQWQKLPRVWSVLGIRAKVQFTLVFCTWPPSIVQVTQNIMLGPCNWNVGLAVCTSCWLTKYVYKRVIYRLKNTQGGWNHIT